MGLIFCLKKKPQFVRKYPSKYPRQFWEGRFDDFYFSLTEWKHTAGQMARDTACIKGWGDFLPTLKGNPIKSKHQTFILHFPFFFCAQKLSRSAAYLHREVPAWEQTDRPIPASCLATCQRAHSGFCVLKGGKAQAEAQVCLIMTFSPAMLKLALHIRLRTRCLPEKGIERLRYPCIFCLLHRVDGKPNNVFKAVLRGEWGTETEQGVGHSREGKWCFSEGMSSTSQKLPLPSGTSQLEHFLFLKREDFQFSKCFKMLVLSLTWLIPICFCHETCNSLVKLK